MQQVISQTTGETAEWQQKGHMGIEGFYKGFIHVTSHVFGAPVSGMNYLVDKSGLDNVFGQEIGDTTPAPIAGISWFQRNLEGAYNQFKRAAQVPTFQPQTAEEHYIHAGGQLMGELAGGAVVTGSLALGTRLALRWAQATNMVTNYTASLLNSKSAPALRHIYHLATSGGAAGAVLSPSQEDVASGMEIPSAYIPPGP